MRIKRLELMGFKSFMSKTIINFDEKVTGIVGPNGCGKSNIIDALLWVMGEQSPKNLRGSNMEDVIFTGSDRKKPSSLAEVSIILENDGVFPVHYLNFSEIKITRRLYRNGESEYLINKVAVRLKDVREIFMDSGARAYAVIEQGEIERIILSKADDRRTLIEEAAGITKYKVRKEESKRKLESTEQNLLRLNDIINEITKQLSQLEKQAKKASEYRTVKNDLKDLEIKHASYEYVQIEKELKTIKDALSSLEEQKQTFENEVLNMELNIETDKAKKLGFEEKISNLQEKTVVLNTAIHKAKAKLEMIESEKANLINGAEIRKHEIESLKIRLEREEQELVNIQNEYNSYEDNFKKAEADVNYAQSMLDAKLNEHNVLISEIDEKKSKLLEFIQKELTAKNSISNFGERLDSNIIKLEKHKEDKEKSLKDFSNIKETLALLEGNFIDNQKKKTELDEEQKKLNEDYTYSKNQLEIKDKEKQDLRNKLGTVSSKLQALVDISNKMEDMSDGVRSVVACNAFNEKIKGIIANIVETEPEFEKALAAVLGDNLEAIVLHNAYDSCDFLNFLKNEHKGLASFIPHNLKTTRSCHGDFIFGGTAESLGLLHLPSVVKFDSEYEEVFKALLGNVFIVSDISSGIKLWEQAKSNDFILVTKDGDLIDGMGVLKGGSSDATNSLLLERKREIRKLEAEASELSQIFFNSEEDCRILSEKISTFYSKIEQNKNLISELTVEIISISKEIDSTKEEIKRNEQRISELNFDIDQMRFENDHLEREIKSYTDMLGDSNEQIRIIESDIEQRKVLVSKFNEEIDELRKNLMDLKIIASSVAERYKNVEERITFLNSALQGDKERLNNLISEQEKSKLRSVELTQEAEMITQQSYVDMETLDNVTRGINDVKHEYSSVASLISSVEESLRSERNKLNQCKDEMNKISVNIAQMSSNTGILVQRFYDKYDINLLESYKDYSIDDYDLDFENSRINELNEKMSKMGEVNLFAIEEFDKLKERFDFLSNQRDDLLNSIDDLKSAIKKIDDTSKERFKRTFDLVNDKFQKFFPILFGGGKAQLVMTDSSDILSTGVDIVAQLPGKKTQNLSLFSGGEKALTAISLVFSIFAIKPSPFCVLDEVDAPLDDANITRFNEAVKALMERTQFTIITHNKRTMEMLEVLYGVTMEEPGVSRMVSVRLGEMSSQISKQEENDFYNEDVFLQ